MNGSYGTILIMMVAKNEWFMWYDPKSFGDCYSIILEKRLRNPILCTHLGLANY